MDVAKKMMEKWGWKKGQGIGKEGRQGMTTPLLLKKADGSSSQGRIIQALPKKDKGPVPEVKIEEDPGAPITVTSVIIGKVKKEEEPSTQENVTGVAELTATDDADDPAAKRQRTDQGADVVPQQAAGLPQQFPPAPGSAMPMVAVPVGGGMYDLDPRDAGAFVQAQANRELQASLGDQLRWQQMQVQQQVQSHAQQAQMQQLDQMRMQATAQVSVQGAMAAALDGVLKFPNLVQLGMNLPETSKAEEQKVEPKEEDELPPLAIPKVRTRVRQYVQDDWRWSKGMEALRYFEEVQLAPSLLELARKILGTGSRYPARIADDTDCVTEVTAWGTLLVRPRGTGANVALAKRMLYEVLHPSGGSLREDALITPDEMAEAAVRDQTTISVGEEDWNAGEAFKVGVKRSSHGDLKRVGLGAEEEAMEEKKTDPKSESKEVTLATQEDTRLVAKHLDDLRIASGSVPVLTGNTLKLLGKDNNVKKAIRLVKTLVETGEWVALTEGFVMSEDTKDKRKQFEGPSEQILIKIAEGTATAKIEKHLKSMERAAAADQLKLTSKAVNGKRTLMVDGTRAAHERVKLMVKELSEKGESPMLTKALGVARGRGLKGFSSMSPAPPVVQRQSVIIGPGTISAAPVIIKDALEEAFQEAKEVEAKEEAESKFPTSTGLGPGPAMRHLPKPRLAAEMSKGESLFSGLPSSSGGEASSSSSAGELAAFPPMPPSSQSFPPMPPGLEVASAAGVDLLAGLPAATSEVAGIIATSALPKAGSPAGPPATQAMPGITE